MAKLLPNGGFSGSVGDTTYSRQKNGEVVVRSKPTGTGQTILHSPDCERSRENFREFGRASRCAKHVRHSLVQLIKGYKLADSSLSGRLNVVMVKILQSDGQSDRGERCAHHGDVSLLKGFAFRSEAEQDFSRVFRTRIVTAMDTCTGLTTATLAPFDPRTCIQAPGGATHFRLLLNVASVQWEQEDHSTEMEQSAYLSLAAPLNDNLSLTAVTAPPAGSLLLCAIGVVFYAQREDGRFVEVPGGVMRVLEAKMVPAGNEALREGNEATRHPGNEGKAGHEGLPGNEGKALCAVAETGLLIRRVAQQDRCYTCVAPQWLSAGGVAQDEKAIDAIGEHVQQQADGDDACWAGNEHQYISADCPHAVQGMVTDAAAAGIEDRRSKEMIQVDEHGEQQDHIDPEPARTVDPQGDEYREYKVQEVVNGLLHAGAKLQLFGGHQKGNDG